MNTPICDFINEYAKTGNLRFHMPGHKGVGETEWEDITEIAGADSLYEADGIIKQSESNAGSVFGCHTFYSTEGSSLSIRAMLYLTAIWAKSRGQRPRILAGRNAHKAFLSAAALLDIDVDWIIPTTNSSYLSCPTDADELRQQIQNVNPTAVYITSPDYLGNIVDIKSIATICDEFGVVLLVDNAHGAYLKFLPDSIHPIDLGAHMCSDSAHKTLPVLTGGAYLHVSRSADPFFAANAKSALALFGSTSPSYLILSSLDRVNSILSKTFADSIKKTADAVKKAKDTLAKTGYDICGNEPMKLTIAPKSYGYTGNEIADTMRKNGIECEFCDNDFIVFMVSPANTNDQINSMVSALSAIEKKTPICELPPTFKPTKRICDIRTATFSPAVEIDIEAAEGRVLASANVSCPPAVPILMCGEMIDSHAIECFKYYGIKTCRVTEK